MGAKFAPIRKFVFQGDYVGRVDERGVVFGQITYPAVVKVMPLKIGASDRGQGQCFIAASGLISAVEMVFNSHWGAVVYVVALTKRSILTILMRVLVLALSITLCACNTDKITQLERENQDLRAKLDSVTRAKSLALQEKCAKQARDEFKSQGWAKEQLAGYTNHYVAQLNKCFIIIQSTDTKTAPGQIITTMSVFDAFEGKQYADYFWETKKGKKYWEVKPFLCKVTLPSGEEKVCTSEQEFTELIRPYTEQ
jgi:hypothetical protein